MRYRDTSRSTKELRGVLKDRKENLDQDMSLLSCRGVHKSSWGTILGDSELPLCVRVMKGRIRLHPDCPQSSEAPLLQDVSNT